MKEISLLFSGEVPGMKSEQDLLVSFWMADVTKDLYPRATIEICSIDSSGKAMSVDYTTIGQGLKALDDSWGLIEFPVKPKPGSKKIQITIWNKEFRDDTEMVLDELFIRPATSDIYKVYPDGIAKNNRFYFKK